MFASRLRYALVLLTVLGELSRAQESNGYIDSLYRRLRASTATSSLDGTTSNKTAQWVEMKGLPSKEGADLNVDTNGVSNLEDMKSMCEANLDCVGFSYWPAENLWYPKRKNTGFDPVSAIYSQKRAGETWKWFFLTSRVAPSGWSSMPGLPSDEGASTVPKAKVLAPTNSAANSDAPRRLKITNACDSEPLWITFMANHNLSELDPPNVVLHPMESYEYLVPDGLSSTRYWAKIGCDEDGQNCEIGDSGGPGQKGCEPNLGCAPPLDTKFEATFGVRGKPCSPAAGEFKGCDFVDVSLVDGFTLPFAFKILGDCKGRFANDTDNVHKVVNCSTLSVEDCPCYEDLGVGEYFDLQLDNPHSKRAVGCYSPCGKLTYSNWNNKAATGHFPGDHVASPFCCPTPPETPDSCSTGPVVDTAYVKAIHKMCPDVYAYAYDDRMGLLSCPAGTKYEMVYHCPTRRSAQACGAKPAGAASHVSYTYPPTTPPPPAAVNV